MTIAKIAVDPHNMQRPTFFYRSAREGMTDFLSSYRPGATPRVLLPSWIGWSAREGSGVFDPIRQRRALPTFYRLNLDLTADLDDLASRIEREEHDIIVLIHYFGRTDPSTAQIAELAHRHGVVLVEDLAHALFSEHYGSPAGSFGDLSVYALHKMLPMSRGGMVRYSGSSLVKTQRSTQSSLGLDMLNYDWDAISRARRSNFSTLTEQLRNSRGFGDDFDLLWPDLASTDVPQTLPLRLETGDRDKVYKSMNADGYGMVSLYHTLIDELHTCESWLAELSQRIINFPVHQDMRPSQIDDLLKAFTDSLKDSDT